MKFIPMKCTRLIPSYWLQFLATILLIFLRSFTNRSHRKNCINWLFTTSGSRSADTASATATTTTAPTNPPKSSIDSWYRRRLPMRVEQLSNRLPHSNPDLQPRLYLSSLQRPVYLGSDLPLVRLRPDQTPEVVAHQSSPGAPLQRKCAQVGAHQSPAGHCTTANVPRQLGRYQHEGCRSDCNPTTSKKEHGWILGMASKLNFIILSSFFIIWTISRAFMKRVR